ncbi:MAG: AAA family ATPase [Caldilineales bacterium]
MPARQLAWKTQPSLHVPFTGRDDALAELGRAYRRAQSGQGGVVMVTGEAGMGKTRLVQEFAGRLPDNGLVLVGSSQRESLAAPYGSPVEALRSGLEQAARTLSDGGRRARLADLLPGGVAPIWLSEASRLLPELRALAPNLPQPIDIRDPDAARSRLFEALHRLLAALPAPRQTTLLFLDDLHWADDATVGWLSYLASKLRRSRLLLVAALRPTENANLDDLRATLSRRQALHEMALAGWDQATVQQVLERLPRLTVEDAAGMAARLHNTTGGNPFFVLSIVQEMIEGGSENGAGKLPVPGQVREVLERRVQRLQPAARQVLEAGAVLGARCDFALLQATSGRDGLETADGLDELVARQMLDPLPAGFQFHHDLIRATAYDRMSSWRRRLLHSRAADTLEERLAAVKAGTKTGTGEIEFQEIDLVRLLAEQHISAGNEKRAVPYLITIGHHLCGTYANKAAIPYFEQALDIAPESDLDTRWEVLQSMVEINWWRDDMVTWEKYTLRLLDLARRTENNHRLAISLHWMARASATGKTANLDEGLGYIRQALALAKAEGDIDLEAAIRGDWGGILWRQGDYEGSIEQRTLHLKAMRKLGNRRGEVIALYQLASIIGSQGDELLAESYWLRALTLAQEIEDQNWQAVVIAELVGFTLQRGDINTSKLLVKAASLLEISGDDLMADFIHAETNGALAMIEEILQKAEEYFRQALTFAQLRGHTFLEAYALSKLLIHWPFRGVIGSKHYVPRRSSHVSSNSRTSVLYLVDTCSLGPNRTIAWQRAASADLVEKIVSHLERGGQLPRAKPFAFKSYVFKSYKRLMILAQRTLLDTIYTRMRNSRQP